MIARETCRVERPSMAVDRASRTGGLRARSTAEGACRYSAGSERIDANVPAHLAARGRGTAHRSTRPFRATRSTPWRAVSRVTWRVGGRSRSLDRCVALPHVQTIWVNRRLARRSLVGQAVVVAPSEKITWACDARSSHRAHRYGSPPNVDAERSARVFDASPSREPAMSSQSNGPAISSTSTAATQPADSLSIYRGREGEDRD